MDEVIKLQGECIIEVIDKNTNEIIDKRESKNLIVNSGKNLIADKSIKSRYPVIYKNAWWGTSVIAIGLNGTAPSAEQTSLLDLYRSQEIYDLYWSEIEQKIILKVLFVDFTETKYICEAGIYTHNSLFNRVTFSSIEVNPNIHLRVIFKITP